jgi:hypothetical protein
VELADGELRRGGVDKVEKGEAAEEALLVAHQAHRDESRVALALEERHQLALARAPRQIRHVHFAVDVGHCGGRRERGKVRVRERERESCVLCVVCR